jgi:glycosyltransferase involved in cell wall biosynthesis
MKILLLGEYNSSHYTLKEGLQKLGHEVLVVGHGDGFKKRKVDLSYSLKYTTGFSSKIKIALYKLFGFDITSLSVKKQFNGFKKQLTGFDIVQLINETPFNTIPKVEKELLDFIFKNNKNVFLLSCGTDYVSIKYAHDKKFRYSILTPYFNNKSMKKDLWHALMYLTTPYVKLHEYVYKNIKGVIASDLDYHIPLIGNEKYLGMAPNPINLQKLEYIDLEITGKIIIFHGINSFNYYKKGNDIFEEALALLNKKHADKIEIITVKSLPYKEYIKAFDTAHILLDQVFAYDQGFNALEAMAKGKVVFTGAEQEWLDYFNIEEDTIAINALPDAEKIAEKLEWLILNPTKIKEISKNARAFIEKEHHYVDAAKIYLEKWKSKL